MSDDFNEAVDLTNCDREPIHQLGMIQDFGALVACTTDWIIAHLSANAPEILQARKDIKLGDPLSQHFSRATIDLLRERLGAADGTDSVERLFGVDVSDNGKLFDIAVHKSGEKIVIELEPHDPVSMVHHAGSLRPIMERLDGQDTVAELCDEAAREMKRLLGFDRVMVYRFHPDQSGEVVAEAREPHLEAFLNLRYPKTDIPEQARRLYLRNLFRIISDVESEPVAIVPPAGIDGRPLDLSSSTLRSVSPIHIEYLKNMGVGASLSISIVIRGKLWGLFACHHYAPKRLPYSLRTLAELFSQLFSLKLEMAITSAGAVLRDKAQVLHDRLMTRLVGGSSLADNLSTIEDSISSIIPHDGLSAYIEGEYRSRGSAPTEEEFKALVPALNTSSTSSIVHSEELASLIPAAEDFVGRAAGAMVIPVSRRPRDYVVLWRKELKRTVTWAGNPEKPVEYGPNGARLTPRKSFSAWQQSVEGRSAPWTPEEVAIAENLRVTLLEVILRITDEAMQERARNQERQELLIAELNHRVRNILTLIRSLVSQSRGETKDIGEFADLIGGRIRALATAHDNITREHWSPAPLRDLVMGEAEAYLSGKIDRVKLQGPNVLVAPEAYTVLALVVHEMMTNSAKYGALCDSNGRLEIRTSLDQHGDLKINWREKGGPPVKAPERRGFGTVIIENSIPFELGGAADVQYKLSGVEAEFLVPRRYITARDAQVEEKAETDSSPSEAPSVSAQTDGGYVLLVEDSLIIAMDAEESLTQIGCKDVRVASNAPMAMEHLDKEAPYLALLDFNLGDETSESIAERLAKMGVPFWFVTGYGEAVGKLTDGAARGVLQKPYSSEDLRKIVESL